GVAAQWCGTAPASYRFELEQAWKKEGRAAPKWGARRAVLNDLSPAATFIGANYNIPFDVDAFAKAGKQLLKAMEQDIDWMYETLHSDGKTKARIEYTVWSEFLICRACLGEFAFTEAAVDPVSQEVADIFPCPHCGAQGTKEQMDLRFESFFDPVYKTVEKKPKRIPVLI
ncbi:DNA methylase, partial [Achromobacter sp. Marseille-Q0513]|nr:DNA methylase [Achromobacter sp. Marseille-Q0513]